MHLAVTTSSFLTMSSTFSVRPSANSVSRLQIGTRQTLSGDDAATVRGCRVPAGTARARAPRCS
jgi:hypothetical protein